MSQFVRLIEDLRRDTASLALPELVDHVLDLSGLRAHYKADKEGRDRLENLDELINATANFLAGMIKSLPPLHEVAAVAGIELPKYLGEIKAPGTEA